MSKLTLDEAIKHCLEVADSNNLLADKFDEWDEWEKADADNCRSCAADHRQLAEWLTELKEAKRLLKVAVEDFAVYGALKDLSSEQRVQNPDWRRFNRIFDVLDHQWRYADDALKLLGGSENG